MTRIAVIGGGPGGLAFCHELLQSDLNFQIDLYVGENGVGGLASNSREFPQIEMYYHHIFKSDSAIHKLCKSLGFEVSWLQLPTFNLLSDCKIVAIDSISNLSKLLGFWGLFRLGIGVVISKLTPRWIWVNKSIQFYSNLIFGASSVRAIWEPLLSQKFGKDWVQVDFVWLISRIADRSVRLGFIKSGYGEIWDRLFSIIQEDQRVNCKSTNVKSLTTMQKLVRVEAHGSEIFEDYDYVFTSTGSFFRSNETYRGVECLILELDKFYDLQFYWLNLLHRDSEYTVMVNHSLALSQLANKVDASFVYLARYVDQKSLLGDYETRKQAAIANAQADLNLVFFSLRMTPPKIVNFEYNSNPYAQPVFTSRNNHEFRRKRTELKENKILLSDMWATFPHDRGQNYAVVNAISHARKLWRILKV
jgi:protoporphyrinogen oxidase